MTQALWQAIGETAVKVRNEVGGTDLRAMDEIKETDQKAGEGMLIPKGRRTEARAEIGNHLLLAIVGGEGMRVSKVT